MKKSFIFLLFFIFGMFFNQNIISITHASVPAQMNYQGILTDTDGNSVNDTMSVTFSIKIDTPEGEQTVNPAEYTGTGTADDPFTYNWKPGSLFTERKADDPLPGDITYEITFRFYADGSNLPSTYKVTWTDYATADDNAADTPEDQQDFEALYKNNLNRITQMERIFDPSVPSEFNYTIKDIEGIYRAAVIKIPAIPFENLLIDNPGKNNLGYNPDADTFDIDPDNQEDMKLVPGDLLRLKIGSYNFSDTPAEGVTITFEAATGKYKGSCTLQPNPSS